MSGPDPLAACRNIPLDRVAAALGYRRDPADRGRFKREGSVISIDGEKFFDHLSGTGGGGAIDLVIHATGCRFTDALRFLGGHEVQGGGRPPPSQPPRDACGCQGPALAHGPGSATPSSVNALSAPTLPRQSRPSTATGNDRRGDHGRRLYRRQ